MENQKENYFGPFITSLFIVISFIIVIQIAKTLFYRFLRLKYFHRVNTALNTEFNAFEFEFFMVLIMIMYVLNNNC